MHFGKVNAAFLLLKHSNLGWVQKGKHLISSSISGVANDGGTWGGVLWWHPFSVQKYVKTKKKKSSQD